MEEAEPHPYTAYYCEENIHHLLSRLQRLRKPSERHYAVLISNPSRGNLLFHQKAAEEERGFVIWDYHAVALTTSLETRQTKVWDLDSDLGVETDFEDYFYDTFRPDLYNEGGVARVLLELEEPRFRLVEADNFLRYFASDRSHMLKDSEYIFPPPAWAPICGSSAAARAVKNNLFDRWLDMRIAADGEGSEPPAWKAWEQDGSMYGQVYGMDDFEAEVKALSESITAREADQAANVQQSQPENGEDSPLKDAAVDTTAAQAIAPAGILASLPKKQLLWTVLVSLGINFALPFVNGVMLGFGEIAARDWLAPYIGLTSWSTSHRRTQTAAGYSTTQRGGRQEVPGHPAAKSIVETVAEQAVSGGSA